MVRVTNISSALALILSFTCCIVLVACGSNARERGESGIHEDTSKALYFRHIDNDAPAGVHREGRDTVIDITKRDAFTKTSSASFIHDDVSSLRERRATGVDGDGEVHSRVRRSTDFSASDADAIVAKHNEGRGMVSPEAADMKRMEWDADLATMAQQWSDGCHYEHGNPDNISPFSSVGQNLYIRWGLSAPGTPADGTAATQAWYNEDQYYDYETKSCQSGEVCGHYTQNVWASTYAVGCGQTFCTEATDDDGNTYNGAWLITCNYGPAGNYVGASPYVAGPSCTQCESGIGLCQDNLCTTCSTSDAGCECRADCQNCATLNSDCTCTCTDGFYGSDCSTTCEDTHNNCGANPGWPVSWCTDQYPYVLTNCPLMCSLCNAADPNFVCNSPVLEQNGVLVLLNENIGNWNAIQASVLSSFRTSLINYCSTRQSTCCPNANNTVIDFAATGLTLGKDYPEPSTSTSYWIQVTGISPADIGVCSADDGGILSPSVVLAAINQDKANLESSLGITIGKTLQSSCPKVTMSLRVIFLGLILPMALLKFW